MRTKLLLASLFAVTAVCAAPVLGDYGHKNDYYEDQKHKYNISVPSSYAWVFGLNTRKLEKFLEYQGSKLFPVTEVDVTLTVRDQKTREFEDLKLYETFWFHKSTGIGVSREMKLDLPERSHGAIVIDDTRDSRREGQALSNAIVRLLMDAHLVECDLTVIAPTELCDDLNSGLEHFRFRPIETISSGQQGILLHVISEGEGQDRFDKYYWFDN